MTEFITSLKRAGASALVLALTFGLVVTPVLAQTSTTEAPSAPPPQDPFEIKAAIPNHPRLVLKYGTQFTVFDQSGLMPRGSNYGCGLYQNDTRYLSEWDIQLDDQPLTLLSASTEDGYAGRFIYGNKARADSAADKSSAIDQTLVLERNVVICDALHERLTLTNYGIVPVQTTLKITFAADFADMFEVRGQTRKARGKWQGVSLLKSNDTTGSSNIAVISYDGLDRIARKSYVGFDGIKPDSLSAREAVFKITLAPREQKVIEAAVVATEGGDPAPVFKNSNGGILDYASQKTKVDQAYKSWRASGATFITDNKDFNQLIERNFRDLFILRQPTPKGYCLAAGIPWFAVAFGRDQEVTGLETLVAMPGTIKEILETLSRYQGQKSDPFTEESPGRIMHELRLGEMARLKEIPFIPYYGTIDATPLYLCLLNRYVQTTGDLALAQKLWPNVELALTYIDSELSGGKYLTYGKVKGALSNQGWKDSADSVMYASGKLANPPIALCEVQGYLYEAWTGTANLAESLGKKELAKKLRLKASTLKSNFMQDFWMPKKNYVALALDGEGKQCDVVASNPGHVLATGLLSAEQTKKVATALSSKAMQSGFGIRTLAASEKSYNPISYHNGSIWPHDNALAVQGLVKAGLKKEAANIAANIWDVAVHQPDMRLPELFCGFDRGDTARPVWYPVSCSPQAWAAGAPLFMLTNLLGLDVHGQTSTLKVLQPTLPKSVSVVTIKGLKVGKGTIDLQIEPAARQPVKVLKQSGGVKIIQQ